MSTTSWVLLFTISYAAALKTFPHRTSLRSAINAVGHKQSDLDLSPSEYSDLRPFKHHGEQRDDFDQLNEEEFLNEYMRENGQEETIGDGFQNVHDGLGNAYQGYPGLGGFDQYKFQNDEQSSNFRERERSKAHRLNREELIKEVLAQLAAGQVDDMDTYGTPREVQADPRYVYEIAGNSYKPKLYNEGGAEDNWDDYYNPVQDYSPPMLVPQVERRNVNARYPLGRDLHTLRDLYKRFPVTKRSPKPLTKKRQVAEPKMAPDMNSAASAQPAENQNHVRTTTVGEQNHTLNHEDHTTVLPLLTVVPKNLKEKEPTQSLKSKEHVIDVQKKSVDWTQYFGYDRRKKKAVLSPRPGSQNQDDAYFMQNYFATMGENLQPHNKRYNRDIIDEKKKAVYKAMQEMRKCSQDYSDALDDLLIEFAKQEGN